MPSGARHIRGFLSGSDAAAALLLELRRREDLLARVRALLPANLARHCTQAMVEDRRLTLICDSPVWVDRLRFLSPQFLAALGADGIAVSDCRVRAQPVAHRAATDPERPLPRPGSAAVQAVEQTAAAVGDTGLAASLRRLAGTLRGTE
jgi:hypothetical protein